jgi:hypothetical protein
MGHASSFVAGSLALMLTTAIAVTGAVVGCGMPFPNAERLRISTSAQDAAPDPAKAPARKKVAASIEYRNTRYDFCFSLPESWKGYSSVAGEWRGSAPGGKSGSETRGPIINIRHPLWTKEAPRQDIPIMVFTREQWGLVKNGDLIVSAAPIGPSELGSTSKYVFALPPRYNYAYLAGYEGVDAIVREGSLHAPCKAGGDHP